HFRIFILHRGPIRIPELVGDRQDQSAANPGGIEVRDQIAGRYRSAPGCEASICWVKEVLMMIHYWLCQSVISDEHQQQRGERWHVPDDRNNLGGPMSSRGNSAYSRGVRSTAAESAAPSATYLPVQVSDPPSCHSLL